MTRSDIKKMQKYGNICWPVTENVCSDLMFNIEESVCQIVVLTVHLQ